MHYTESIFSFTTNYYNMAVAKTESVKLRSDIVNKVRKNKVKTGVPIAIFIEQATTEKLKNISVKNPQQ